MKLFYITIVVLTYLILGYVSQSDDCINAEVLINGDVFSGTTVTATTSTPAPACTIGFNNDVWYQFTAGNTDQVVRIYLCTASFDSVLVLHESSSCASVNSTCAGFDDNGCDTPFGSFLQSVVIPNQSYYFRVGGNSTSGTFSGRIVLDYNNAGGNECIGAKNLTEDIFGYNIGATLSSAVLCVPNLGTSASFGALASSTVTNTATNTVIKRRRWSCSW